MGHSVVIRTDPRLQRVLVGNPGVVTTATTSPNEVVVTAVAPGSSSVVLWQENNQSRIIEVFSDVDVSLLREAIARGMPGELIEAESEEGRVVLTGRASSTAVAEQIGKMAVPFSKEIVNSIQIALPHRQKQILLKVRFAQVDRYGVWHQPAQHRSGEHYWNGNDTAVRDTWSRRPRQADGYDWRAD